MSTSTDKIYSHLMAGAVGIVLGMGIASNRATNALNTKRKVASSSITEVTEQGTPPQYPEGHPSYFTCLVLQEKFKGLNRTAPEIPSGCTFYTNPFWQYICATPEQYNQMRFYDQWQEQVNLLQQWQAYRKCEQGNKRKL